MRRIQHPQKGVGCLIWLQLLEGTPPQRRPCHHCKRYGGIQRAKANRGRLDRGIPPHPRRTPLFLHEAVAYHSLRVAPRPRHISIGWRRLKCRNPRRNRWRARSSHGCAPPGTRPGSSAVACAICCSGRAPRISTSRPTRGRTASWTCSPTPAWSARTSAWFWCATPSRRWKSPPSVTTTNMRTAAGPPPCTLKPIRRPTCCAATSPSTAS